MAKLFFQEIPSLESFQASISEKNVSGNVEPLYTMLLFSKVSNEVENTMDALLTNYGLSVGRFIMLSYLAKKENLQDGVKPSEMATRLGVTQATMSGLITNLEKLGYVEKKLDASDGRSYALKVSQKGEEVVSAILPICVESANKYVAVLEPDERESLYKILNKLIAVKLTV